MDSKSTSDLAESFNLLTLIERAPTISSQETDSAQLAEAFPFLDLPTEIQILIIEKLINKPWVMNLSGHVASSNDICIKWQMANTLPVGALQIPELRKLVASAFYPRAIFQRRIYGTLSFTDNIYTKLLNVDEAAEMIRAVSNGVRTLQLVDECSKVPNLKDLKHDFPNLQNVRIKGNRFMRDYWRTHGPQFEQDRFQFPHLVVGTYDELFCQQMSYAIDALMPSRKCEETKDIKIRVKLAIRGSQIEEFLGPESRLGVDDFVVIEFIRQGRNTYIRRKWFYVTVENSQQSFFLKNPFNAEIVQHFAKWKFDGRRRAAPRDPASELILLD